jgi:hypothetical protein
MTTAIGCRATDWLGKVVTFEGLTTVKLACVSILGQLFGAREVDASAELVDVLESRVADLELALEDRGWQQLTMSAEFEFSRDGLHRIVELARAMYVKNPLVNRGVEVKKLYVWANGITIDCQDETAKQAITDFLTSPGNDRALFGQQAAPDSAKELQVAGNLFIACFPGETSAAVMQVRTIPFEEVTKVLRNPQDRSEPWYYKREWTEVSVDPDLGSEVYGQRTAYYPDWRYKPESAERPDTIGSHPVEWDTPVCHVKVGGFAHWEFGVSEVYGALDWARMHTENLQNWASITKALARFAWRLKTKGGAKGVAAAKTKLASTAGKASGETNPPPVAASTFIAGEGHELDPIKTAGATSSPADSRFLLLQVASSLGLPEFFFGNADVGNYATSRTLDRPTEMTFVERQKLWAKVYSDLCAMALESRGITSNEPVTVTFPPILEHDVDAAMSALVKGITLEGKAPVVVPDMRQVAKMVFDLLAVPDAAELLDTLFPEGGTPEQQVTQAESELVSALGELRESIAATVKKAASDA